MVAFIGRFHPLAVHLPIGICLLVGVLEVLASSSRLRPRIDPAFAIILRLALASAIVAVVLGLLLAHGGGYPERLIWWHQRLAFATVLAAATSVVTWSLYGSGRISRRVHRSAVTSMLILLGAGAHFGGSLTHGAGYLVEYAPSFVRGWTGGDAPAEKASPPPRAESEKRLFADAVLPVLERRCTGCHGVSSAKGQLRLDTFEALMKGGKSGSVVEIGDAKRSLIVHRMTMPIADDGHMPPEGRTQPTADEIELIGVWIDHGANAETKVRDLLVPDGARRLLAEVTGGSTTHSPPPPAAPSAPATSSAPSTSSAPALAPTQPARTARAPATVRPPAPPVMFSTVAPLLARRCGKCHGGDEPAGGMSVRDRDTLVAKSYVVPGRPNASPLFTRMTLALEHDDHMPPMDAPQPSRAEIELVRSWIERGATASTHAP